MEVLIESTRGFENDLDSLDEAEKALVVESINDCASLFPTHKTDVYRKLHHLPLLSNLNGYESSLYTLRTSQELRVILTVDEDPIFEQVILTLFRVVNHRDLDRTYEAVAASLYQEILHHDRETTHIL